MKYKKWQIIKISWIDSSGQDSWQYEPNLDISEKYLQCESVGYFLQETKNSIAIAQSYTPPREKKSVNAIIQIPKVAIKKIKKL
jgi:glucose dehydrogenase